VVEQDNALSGDGLLSSDRAKRLACFRLDPDPVHLGLQQFGEPTPESVAKRENSRSLGHDHAVKIDQLKTGETDSPNGGGQHFARILAFVGRIGIGKELSDVAEPGGSEQRVGHGVEEDIGVTVARQVLGVRDIDTAKSQRAAVDKPM